jgi:ubiquinol-cytochrome c reductase cytochrome b subunit
MTDPERDPEGFLERRLGAAPAVRAVMRYVFPDHWTFQLGEIALYSFLVLVGTGVYLALFFEPSLATTYYHGSFAPLEGAEVTHAYASTVDLSYDVPAGLLIRQAHHWAALIFLVAIVLHVMRIFFTGAFRKPRELNWMIGVTLLGLALVEGFAGYSLPDDLLSGMGLAIAYSVLMGVPLIGGDLAHAVWGGQFPGSLAFHSRLYIGHVFLLPAALATLIGLHLALVVRQRHTQFPGPGRTERNDVGTPTWPGYALRSLSLLFAVAAAVFLLGGLVQINPIWQWGPYDIWKGTNGAQPDWYLGWLIGALRLMPAFEPHIGGATLVPNPFFGGALFPSAMFLLLYAWPWIEERFVTRDLRRHELLDRPRDNPFRTAVGVAVLTFVVLVFMFGTADRVLVTVGFAYSLQLTVFRVALFVAPPIAFLVTLRLCRTLKATGAHPLRGFSGRLVRRAEDGSLKRLAVDGGDPDGRA